MRAYHCPAAATVRTAVAPVISRRVAAVPATRATVSSTTEQKGGRGRRATVLSR